MTDAAPQVDEVVVYGRARRKPSQNYQNVFSPPTSSTGPGGGSAPGGAAAKKPPSRPSLAFLPPILPPVIEEIFVTSRAFPPAISIPVALVAGFGALVYGIYESGKRATKRSRKARQDKRDRAARDSLAPSSDQLDLSLPASLANLLQSPTEIALDPYALGYFSNGIDAPPGGDDRIEEIFVTGTARPPSKPPNRITTAVSGDAFDWFDWIGKRPFENPERIPEWHEIIDETVSRNPEGWYHLLFNALDQLLGNPTPIGDDVFESEPEAQPQPQPETKPNPGVHVVPSAPGIEIDPLDYPTGVPFPDFEPLIIPPPLAIPIAKPRPIKTPLPFDSPFVRFKPNPLPKGKPYAFPFGVPYVSPGTKPTTGNKPKTRPRVKPIERPLTGPKGLPVPLFGIGPQTDTFLTPKIPIKTDTCTCAKKKKEKKRERKKRTNCSRGTYVKRANGIDYKVTENIPCR